MRGLCPTRGHLLMKSEVVFKSRAEMSAELNIFLNLQNQSNLLQEQLTAGEINKEYSRIAQAPSFSSDESGLGL